MTFLPELPPHNLSTLRDRQRNDVRAEVIKAGIELFLANGFNETSVDEIAEKARVSRRTVFRHFVSKDDIIIAWSGAAAEDLVAAVHRRDPAEPALACLCSVLLEYVANNADQLPSALAIARLIADTPSLRARSAEKYVLWEERLCAALINRADSRPNATRLAPVAAAIAVGVFRVAASAWVDSNGRYSLLEILRDRYGALAILQQEVIL